MQIKIWYSEEMRQWRWILTNDDDNYLQESGQQKYLGDAMADITATVEYVLECNQSE
jgi:hypothetical protein|tara:strand:- start:945 stop:1115 length:171 start_codon:yes stop_codon:yes gene_type:complete